MWEYSTNSIFTQVLVRSKPTGCDECPSQFTLHYLLSLLCSSYLSSFYLPFSCYSFARKTSRVNKHTEYRHIRYNTPWNQSPSHTCTSTIPVKHPILSHSTRKPSQREKKDPHYSLLKVLIHSSTPSTRTPNKHSQQAPDKNASKSQQRTFLTSLCYVRVYGGLNTV